MTNQQTKYKSAQKIISSSKDLFWKYGIRKVYVEDICEAADISKMTFYRYFDNKIEVLKLILLQEIVSNIIQYQSIMSAPILFKEKVSQVIDLKLKQNKNISLELMKDLHRSDPKLDDLKQELKAKQDHFLDLFKCDLVLAQSQGQIRENIKIEFIMYMIGQLGNIQEDPAFTQLYDNTADLSGELLNFFFYGILEKSE